MNNFIVALASVGKLLCRPLFPTKIIGPRKFEDKKCLYVANHLSGFDPVIFTMWTRGFKSFVYKAEFENVAFLRWVFDGLECIPVHRGEADLNATKMILRQLNKDKGVVLFPEGTRNPNVDCLQEFHTGAALFAIKTKAPIRPFYIWDKTKIFRLNYIIVGEEFTLDEFYDKPITKVLLEEATEVIKQKVDDLRVELNAILAKKNVKRRKRTEKEVEKIRQYNSRQKKFVVIEHQKAEQAKSPTDGEGQ